MRDLPSFDHSICRAGMEDGGDALPFVRAQADMRDLGTTKAVTLGE